MKTPIPFRLKTFIPLLFALFVNLSCFNTFAQIDLGNQNLRQGAYFTESQAEEIHKNLASLYSNQAEWEKRREVIRQGILDGAGIEQLIRNRPVNATIHGKKVLKGYTVENVFFESMPGIYISGNLYKPLKIKGKVPGILCPHGHGLDPRFKEYTQQRCATLARMGAIVFAYDMVGHGDMKQADHKIENVFKSQLINSVRVVDFLTQMPDVDVSRIACTGESGGGTQTFMLAALDDRIAVSVPVVMISGYFFGGCQCESGMPVHKSNHHATTNVEIAACFAPKPMIMISDGGDWTKNTPELEFPFVQRIYGFYKAENQIENVHLANEKHDYGPSKREAAYQFLAKKLGLSIAKLMKEGRVDESPNSVLSFEELSVFNEKFPRPANAVMGNEALVKAIATNE